MDDEKNYRRGKFPFPELNFHETTLWTEDIEWIATYNLNYLSSLLSESRVDIINNSKNFVME